MALTSSFVQRLDMTMYSVFCILSWTLKLVPLKMMKMMMDMDMEER